VAYRNVLTSSENGGLLDASAVVPPLEWEIGGTAAPLAANVEYRHAAQQGIKAGRLSSPAALIVGCVDAFSEQGAVWYGAAPTDG
jgi:hypothetical protein